MAEARSLGLPRNRTFRSQPGRADPPEPAAEFFHSRSLSDLALGKAPDLEQLPRAAEVSFLTALLREALVFFLALVFPLLLAPV
jgi:hypothetical protein